MHDVNRWLLALAFLLGLLLTFAMMIRKVTREVPVSHSLSAGVRKPHLDGPDLGKIAGGVTAAGAAATAGAAAKLRGAADKVGEGIDRVGDKIDDLFDRDVHGSGSARVSARKTAPAGYSIKFDPKAGRYLAPGDAGYDELETEWWFTDEASAKAAGFSRWDDFKGKVGALADRAGDKLDAAGDRIGAAADKAGDRIGAAAGAVGDKIEGLFDRDTHGVGSARLTARKDAPAGYSVKFDPEAKRYLAPGDAGYDELETEYWFTDEASAKAAGFSRWENFKGKVGELADRAGDKLEAAGDKIGAAAGAVGDKVDDLFDRGGHGAAGETGAKAAGLAGSAGLVSGAAGAGSSGASIEDVPAGPHGRGSAKAGPGGSGPAGWLIKGNEDSMLFHGPDSPYYERTIAEVWFFDEETAKKAGFDKWDKNIK